MSFGLPLQKKFYITSGYKDRMNPITGKREFHDGIDMTSDSKLILAIEDGEVHEVGHTGPTGPFITVDYVNDIKKLTFYRCLYAHLDSSQHRVYTGSKVVKGQILGAYWKGTPRGGEWSNGPHLHFGMRNLKKALISQIMDSIIPPTYIDVEVGNAINPATVITTLNSSASFLEPEETHPRFAMLPDAGVLNQSNASVGGTNYYGGYENKRNYYGAGGFAALPTSQNALESPINESMENTGNTASGSYSSFYNTNVHNASMNSLGEMSNQISNTFKQGNNDYSSGIFSTPSPHLINSISNGGNSYFSQSSGNPVNITGSQPINSRDGYRVSNFDTLNVSAHNNGTGIPGLNITGNEENTVNQITRGAMLNPIPSGYNKTINTTNNMPVNIHVENSNGVSGENVVSKLVKALKDAKADVAHNPNAGI
jgi:hypothetical protein